MTSEGESAGGTGAVPEQREGIAPRAWWPRGKRLAQCRLIGGDDEETAAK